MDFKEHKLNPAKKAQKNPHLHTASHLLADELATKLRDKSHFGYYLKMTYIHDHAILRMILGQVLESKNITTPGRLFTYLLKQHTIKLKEEGNETKN